MEDKDLRCQKALGSQGRFQSKKGYARAEELGTLGWSYLAVHNGLFLLQLNLLLPCLSTQESLKDRPFRKAALLLQGCLTVWGQGHGEDGSSGKLSLEDSSNCPGGRTIRTEGEKRLSHSQPAADLKIQLHLLRTLRPWRRHSQTLRISRTHSGEDTAKPLYIPIHMEETPTRPSLTPGQTWKDTDSQRRYIWAYTGEIQTGHLRQTKEEIYPDTQMT